VSFCKVTLDEIQIDYIFYQGTIFSKRCCKRCIGGSLVWTQERTGDPYLLCVACNHEHYIVKGKKLQKSDEKSGKKPKVQLRKGKKARKRRVKNGSKNGI
jgi:hypothetical protein